MESELNKSKQPSEDMEKAYRRYIAHKTHMKKYLQNHKDAVKKHQQTYLEKIRNDPEKYEQYLQKKRDYYYNVMKPKLESKNNAIVN